VRTWLVDIINKLFDEIDNKHMSKNKEIIDKVMEYVSTNVRNEELSLKSVSDALYISSNHLSRLFKEYTGITFVEFLSNCKIEEGKKLLLTTNLKVEEISSLVGYSTSQYFISRFKLKYGVTPKDFRIKNGISCNLEV